MKILQIFSVLLLLLSCSKSDKNDPIPGPPGNIPGKMEIILENTINGEKINFYKSKYRNENGDTFSVRSIRYYISNVKLKSDDGAVHSVPESYYFIDLYKEPNPIINLIDIPEGTYSELELSLGVDSSRNHSGAQTGALDPVNQMIWSWDTGYMFLSFYGYYWKQNARKSIVFDIAEDNNLLTYKFNKNSSGWSDLKVESNKMVQVNLKLKFEELFNAPNKISFSEDATIDSGEKMSLLSENCKDLIEFVNVKIFN